MFADSNPDERAALRRAIVILAIVTSVVTLALVAPHYYRYRTPGRWLRLLYVLPSVLPLSLAFGFTAAVIGALAKVSVSRKVVVVVLAGALACSFALFADMTWIGPDANQAYRESAFGGPVARGDREMGMSDLRRQMTIRPDEVRRFQMTYHMRWSLSAAPLALAGLALATLYWQRRPRRVLTIGAICLGYYTLLMFAQEIAIWTMLPVMAVLWLPNIAYAALAAALAWRTSTSFRDNRHTSSTT
jgi:hypothetical protein